MATQEPNSGIFLFLSLKGKIIQKPNKCDYPARIVVKVFKNFLKNQQFTNPENFSNYINEVIEKTDFSIYHCTNEIMRCTHSDFLDFIKEGFHVSGGSIPGLKKSIGLGDDRYLGEHIVHKYFLLYKLGFMIRESRNEIFEDLTSMHTLVSVSKIESFSDLSNLEKEGIKIIKKNEGVTAPV